MLRLIPLLLVLPILSVGPWRPADLGACPTADGTHFEHGLSWAQIQAKAKTENKYILVDCYTTWCGPCRFMSSTIFPSPEAGAFFNDKFINVAVQLDTTARDDREVRRWYADAHALSSMYDVHAYPTYLIFTPDGEPLHRMVGARQTAAAFINEAQEAFDSTRAYYTRLRQFSAGRRDSAFLYRAAMSQAAMYDRENGQLFAGAFLQTQTDPFSRGALEIIMRYNQGSGTNAFTMFTDNTARIDSILGFGAAETYIDNVLTREFVSPQIRTAQNLSPDWERIRQSIAVIYPKLADEVAQRAQVQYYQQHNDWHRFQKAVVLYMQTYGAHASANELNQYARAVFENCKDNTCVSEALEWSKRSLQEGPNARFMDTYANILYKLGKTQDAIAWEEKAADLARGRIRADFEAVLDKMKKGGNAAQEAAPAGKGVHFEEKLSWSAIRAKAKAENKYIFMDCFTTWCGPCRFMATTIFPTPEAGDYFNDKFINVAVQLDTTAKDNAHVRAWYADAHALMAEYSINAFPTYLVFAPDGQPLHRRLGSTATAGDFIKSMAACFDSTTQYYTLLRQYRSGRRDSSFLRNLAQLSDMLYDLRDGKEVAEAWFATQTDPYNQTTLSLMTTFTQTTKDPGFVVFNEHSARVDSILGAGKAEQSVGDILMKEYVNPAVKAAGNKAPDWTAIQTAMSTRFPAVAPEITAKARVLYYKRRQDWTHFLPAIKSYMEQYGAHATSQELNDYAYTVFESCPDMACVAQALEWSKRSFKDQPDASYMDTYANILYKLGKKDEAIAWEQKAMDLAGTNDKSDYQQTIEKMKKGQKTWN